MGLPVFPVPDYVDSSQRTQYTFRVKCLLVFTLLVLCPSVVLSHPGKTDRRGGHRCWKGCAEWQLDYGEYHLHDKDFMPVRLKKMRNTAMTADPPEIQDPAAPVTAPREVVNDNSNGKQQKKYEGTSLPESPEKTYPDEALTSLSECDLALFTLALVFLICLLWMRQKRRRRVVR
jgi:hypothetical protein